MEGRKLPREFENPFDNILIDIANPLTDYLNKYNITPNMITTLSLFLGIRSAYYLQKNKKKEAIIYTLLAYFFDCVDGHLARKYDQVTVFGDYYDHFSDLFKYGILMYILYKKKKKKI